jgi:hypothetical protein
MKLFHLLRHSRIGRSLSIPFDPREATLSEPELVLLRGLVAESDCFDGPIVEIGTLIGRTTTELALANRSIRKIVTVDNYCWNPWALPPEIHYQTFAAILRFPVSRNIVEQVHQDKSAFYQSYNRGRPSLVFLDAMHDYEGTKEDILWAQSVDAEIISGHDYCDEFPGVIQAVDEFGGPKRLAGSVWSLS